MKPTKTSLAAVLLAVFGCVSGVRAELASYALGPGRDQVRLVSSDGYHYASFKKAGWSVDGRALAPDDGAEAIDNNNGACSHCAALSADGHAFLSVARVAASNGGTFFFLAVNGKRFGSPLTEVSNLQVGPKGENAVYVARGPKGCYVVSNAGAGPPFPGCPDPVFTSDLGVIYAAKWNDHTIIYRNHQPIATTDYFSMKAAADLSRFAGVLHSDGGSGLDTVVIGTSTIARLKVSEMFFSADGRHLGVMSADAVFVDAIKYDAPGVRFLSMRPGDGLPFWIAGEHLFKAGKDLGRVGYVNGWDMHGGWLGFSPSSAHYAFVGHDDNRTIGKLILDGEVLEENVPAMSDDARVVFDGEKEFHYIGKKAGDDKVYLVCGTVDGSDPKRTRCARYGALHRAKAE
jgi:hypothetical protein